MIAEVAKDNAAIALQEVRRSRSTGEASNDRGGKGIARKERGKR
jgi:hypothetical protein